MGIIALVHPRRRLWDRPHLEANYAGPFLDRTMPRPPLLKAESAWWVGSLALILSLAFAVRLPAATVITGDATPALPWDNLTTSRIGETSAGTLVVDEGSQLDSGFGTLGYMAGSTGTATITGAGSKWSNLQAIYVGNSGNGELYVKAGGEVNSPSGWLGVRPGSTGTATITGAGSKWINSTFLFVGISGNGGLTVADGGHVSAGSVYASLADFHGDGTIGATGAVLDADLQFNAPQSVLGFGGGGTLTVAPAAGGDLGAGYRGVGSLTISDGTAISSSNAYLGYRDGATGTATVTGADASWTVSNRLYVGRFGSGALRVEAGGQVSNYVGYLGERPGSIGVATVAGAGAKWINSEDLYIGFDGSGSLTVSDGGHVQARTLYASISDLQGNGTIAATNGVFDADLQFNAASPTQAVVGFGTGGTLTVTAGVGVFGVGYRGSGSLTISEGATVSTSTGCLGDRAGSIGVATITGAGSKWTTNAPMWIGLSGRGELRVKAGGHVRNTTAYLADEAESTGIATIAGAGSTWTNSASLYVGRSGSGTIRVEGGGQVSNESGYLGYAAGSTGMATITGAGSKWTNTNSMLSVGTWGSGTLRVAAGGQVSNASGHLGHNSGSTGSATITGVGSKWTNGYFYLGHSGSGQIRVEAGGQVSNTSLSIVGYNGGATGMATITGAGSIWTNSAGLDVGRNGSGALTITAGGLVSVRGTLRIDVNGGGDSFINMATGGTLALWGNADDSLSLFLGLVSGTDAIRYWDASLDGWTPLTAATLGVDYSLLYMNAGDLAGYTLLTVLAAGPPGDFDFDGRVDGADFLAWQRGNSPMPNSPEDLATWRSNFGLSVTTPATTAVPEPNTVSLVGLASASLLLACRSTRGRMHYFTWGRRKPGT